MAPLCLFTMLCVIGDIDINHEPPASESTSRPRICAINKPL